LRARTACTSVTRLDADQHADAERKISRFRAVAGPFRAKAVTVIHDDGANDQQQKRDRDVHQAQRDADTLVGIG